MSQLSAKGSKGATPAEVVLQPQLKSCLVNLPSSLVSVLVNANTVSTLWPARMNPGLTRAGSSKCSRRA
jgi:hypothetical protein